jgi:probable phosphoglycerate mutase
MRFNPAIAAPWALYLSLFTPSSVASFSCPLLARYKQQLDNDNARGERRSVLQTILVAVLAPAVAPPANAIELGDSYATVPTFAVDGNFDCLLDLPPITPGCVRLYLCRHGQTENNRLHLVQGARIDPRINPFGYEQAQRLGMAVSRLTKYASRGAFPHLAVHSKLCRARETAEVVTATASSQCATGSPTTETMFKIYGELPSLQEVDFGSLEGRDVKMMKTEMMKTFASWSMGNLDSRTGGEGESGREVLERAARSLEELGKLTVSSAASSSSILAVSHSTYLRVLLSMVNDTPLAKSALWTIQNGSVNVVDVNVQGKRRLVTSNSGLFGADIISRLRWNNDALLDMPQAHLIRLNEVRHLQGMKA